MTRKDFQLIADVLRRTEAPERVVIGFAEALRHTNPRFNRERFVDSCR